MEKLANKEIAKVFALYLPCEAKDRWGNKNITAVNFETNRVLYSENDWGNPEFWKLLLTPLDKISDEDAIEVAKVAEYYSEMQHLWDAADTGRDIVRDLFGNDIWFKNKIFIYQYLISKGYDVPLWFGIDHWANGKTAIELNIAIPKPKQ